MAMTSNTRNFGMRGALILALAVTAGTFTSCTKESVGPLQAPGTTITDVVGFFAFLGLAGIWFGIL